MTWTTPKVWIGVNGFGDEYLLVGNSQIHIPDYPRGRSALKEAWSICGAEGRFEEKEALFNIEFCPVCALLYAGGA